MDVTLGSYDRQSLDTSAVPYDREAELDAEVEAAIARSLPDPPISNRGVGSLQRDEKGGLDRLKLSMFGSWDLVALDGLKAKIAEAWRTGKPGESSVIKLPNGELATLKPYAPSMGGIRCTAQLMVGGVNVFVVGHASGTMPGLILDAGSLRCMQSGMDIFEEMTALAAGLGFRIEETKISSVDVCVDLLLGDDAEVLMRAITDRQVICHQISCRPHLEGERMTGVSLGKHNSPVMLNVYAKAEELLAGRKDALVRMEKMAYLSKHRWGCDVAEAREQGAVRVEFRMRGKDFLKPRGVRSPEQFRREFASIVHHLTHEWCRVVDRMPDRKNRHQDRCETHPAWSVVEDAFASLVPDAMVRKLKAVRERAVGEVDLLLKQAIGCVVRAVSYTGETVPLDHVQAKAYLSNFFDRLLNDIEDERLSDPHKESLSERSWHAYVDIESKLPPLIGGG